VRVAVAFALARTLWPNRSFNRSVSITSSSPLMGTLSGDSATASAVAFAVAVLSTCAIVVAFASASAVAVEAAVRESMTFISDFYCCCARTNPLTARVSFTSAHALPCMMWFFRQVASCLALPVKHLSSASQGTQLAA